MIYLKRFIFVTVAALSFYRASAAEAVNCPSSIAARQELTKAVTGWIAVIDDAPLQLAGITFYEGPPEEKASLDYDESKKAGSREIATWRFEAQAGRQIWISCSYSGTAIVLARALPRKTASCSITYNPATHVAGLPSIERVVCN